MATAFQVGSSEDAMAINLFKRAADAIVARSELAQSVKSLETESYFLKSRVDALTNERNQMDETIRYLTAQITEAKRNLDEQTRRADDLTYRNDNMATMISGLEETIRRANTDRDEAIAQYVDESDAHAKTKTALADATAKLSSITSALGIPAAPAPAPTVESAPAAPQEVAPVDTFRPVDILVPESSGDLHPPVPQPWSSSDTAFTTPVSPPAEAPISNSPGTPGTEPTPQVRPEPSEPRTPNTLSDVDDYMPF